MRDRPRPVELWSGEVAEVKRAIVRWGAEGRAPVLGQATGGLFRGERRGEYAAAMAKKRPLIVHSTRPRFPRFSGRGDFGRGNFASKCIGPSLLAFGIALFAPGDAHADASEDADAAETAYIDLKYEACIKAANRSIKKPGTPTSRIRAYKFRGLCQAALSDVDAARASFEKMLAIDINAKLPDGLSPRFTSSYFEAKGRWIGREPIALRIDEESVDGDVRTLTLSLKDEAELVRYLAWRDPAEKVFDKVKAAEKIQIEVPTEEAVDVVALDRGGAPVRVTVIPPLVSPEDEGAEETNPFAPPKAKVDDESDEGLPMPLLIGGGIAGGAILVAGVATVVGVAFFLNQQNVDAVPAVTFSEDVIAESE